MDNSFVPVLVARLADKDGRTRERARLTLVLIGPPAVPALLGLAAGSDKRLRWEAAKALGAIADPASLETQVALLSDPESDIRWIASLGVARLGTRALPAVLEILLAKADSTDVRRSVHHVLDELAKDNALVEELVAPLMRVLGDTDPTSVVLAAGEEVQKRIQTLQRGTTTDPAADLP